MTFLAIRAQIAGHMLTAAGCVVVIAQLWSLPVAAQSPLQHSQRRQGLDASKPLALPQDPPIVGRLLNGTAFFVDQSGSMLTARHAVDHCARIVIVKEQHRMQARIVALSVKYDLALIKVSKTLGLVRGRSSPSSSNIASRNGLAPTMLLRPASAFISRLMPVLQMVRHQRSSCRHG